MATKTTRPWRGQKKKTADSLVALASADYGTDPPVAAVENVVDPHVEQWIRGAADSLEDAPTLFAFRRSLTGPRRDIAPDAAAEALAPPLIAARLAGRYDVESVPIALAQSAGGAVLPFEEQIRFFRRKLNLSTEAWTDLWQSGHDGAFMVAGAAQTELLADLRGAVDAAIADGETLASFRGRFDAIVEKHGWSYKGGRGWRTRVIYETNLRSSYAAGRREQMLDVADLRPYWRYRHSHASEAPRDEHLAWDGLVLRYDDPWWDTHYPPNGWGCKCYVEALSERDIERLGLSVGEAPALDEEMVMTGGRLLSVPAGIDPGWAYAPGRTVAQRRHQAAWRDSIENGQWRQWRRNAAPLHRFAPELTTAELIAVRHWTGAGSGIVQRPVREMLPPGGGRGVMPEDRHVAFALTLRDALAKLPRRPPGALYRGVEAIPNLERFRPGETVSFNDFLGTSYDESVANRFAGLAGVRFTIVGPGGRHIEALSVSPREREVLFDIYTRFRVADRIETELRDGRIRYEIELHEVE